MIQFNPVNERIKRQYFGYLRDADGLAEMTIDHAARAIFAFEQFSEAGDFHQITPKAAIAWRKHLLVGPGRRAAELSSRATVRTKLLLMKRFVKWLAQQPGYKARLKNLDAAYFDLPRRDRRIASERCNDEAPSLEQLRHVILSMTSASDREKRDRALMAFLLLTGARVAAIATFKLKHLTPDHQGIRQDAREVWTKGARTYTSVFFPVGHDIRGIFLDWCDHLRQNLHYGPDDPIFPISDRMAAARGNRDKLLRQHWKTVDPIRSICRRAFTEAGLHYHPPHRIRRTLAVLGERICKTGEEMKAWSQNLGHLDVLTTMLSYGGLSERQQSAVMQRMSLDEPVNVLKALEDFLKAQGFVPQNGGEGDAK